MSTNHTPNYGLSQWEADDKVLREEFNRDNQIIDQAMAGFGNCRVEYLVYQGDGKTSRTHHFSGDPFFVIITGCSYFIPVVRGLPYATSQAHNYSATITITWGDKSLTWSADHQQECCNHPNGLYAMIIFYDEKQ